MLTMLPSASTVPPNCCHLPGSPDPHVIAIMGCCLTDGDDGARDGLPQHATRAEGAEADGLRVDRVAQQYVVARGAVAEVEDAAPAGPGGHKLDPHLTTPQDN